jgi:hypothetical protein
MSDQPFPDSLFYKWRLDYIEMAQFPKNCKVGGMTIVNDNEHIKITT